MRIQYNTLLYKKSCGISMDLWRIAMDFTITEQQPTRALLVEADTGDYDAEASLAELFELTESAGAVPARSCPMQMENVV